MQNVCVNHALILARWRNAWIESQTLKRREQCSLLSFYRHKAIVSVSWSIKWKRLTIPCPCSKKICLRKLNSLEIVSSSNSLLILFTTILLPVCARLISRYRPYVIPGILLPPPHVILSLQSPNSQNPSQSFRLEKRILNYLLGLMSNKYKC